jgi:hypothetical protein
MKDYLKVFSNFEMFLFVYILLKYNKIKGYLFQLKIKFKMQSAYEIERFFLHTFDDKKYKKDVYKIVIDISIFLIVTRNLIKKIWYSLLFYVRF